LKESYYRQAVRNCAAALIVEGKEQERLGL
jgi:hypothetical protein